MLKLPAVLLSLLLLLSGLRLASAGEIQAHEFPAPSLGRSIPAYIYLPDGYAQSAQTYPVLYLLHGYGGSERDWAERGALLRIVDDLIQRGAMPAAVIVMPAGGVSWYVDAMENALIHDLLPAAAARFRLRPERQARLIGGLSMGGYGALRLALKYPDLFGAAALFSPAIYDPAPPANSSARKPGVFAPAGGADFDAKMWQKQNYPPLLADFLKTGRRLPVFIASGDDDEYQIEFQAALLYSRLRQAGQPAELRILNGRHAWPVWEAALPEALSYIFKAAGE